MTNQHFLILLCVACLACDSSTDSIDPQQEEDPNWIQLEVPGGRQAYAIAGDINKRLLVTTWTKAYFSDDRGLTWEESYNFHGPVHGLLERNDTVFSLITSNGSIASLSQLYTTDYGKTWERDKNGSFKNLSMPLKTVGPHEGVTYKVIENVTPLHEGSSAFYVNPSDVRKDSEGHTSNIPLPGRKLRVINLYKDKDNYLYLAASSGVFDENNYHVCCEPGSPALIYRSKQPFP